MVISGTGFSPVAADNTVKFNGVAATVTAATATQLSVVAPYTATTGPIQVSYPGEAAVVTATNFTIAPAIVSFWPQGGAAGTAVTISGTSFDSTMGSSIKFNGTPITSASTRSVLVGNVTTWIADVTLPSGATTGPISASVGGVTATSTQNFIVAPVIASVTPSSGSAGTPITLTGSNFNPVASGNAVTIMGVEAQVSSASPTQLIVTTPTGISGSGNIYVTVAGFTSNGISFTSPPSFPTISGFDPTSGPAGTPITISGSNFSDAPTSNLVTFNGTPASVSSSSSNSISATVPAGALTGPIGVSVAGKRATSSTSFTVTGGSSIASTYQYDANGRLQSVLSNSGNAATYSYDALGNLASVTGITSGQLAIFNVSPGQGIPGDSITISGQGFSATPNQNQVKFNGVAANVTSANSTQLLAVVPSAATTRPITVTTNGTTSASPNPFIDNILSLNTTAKINILKTYHTARYAFNGVAGQFFEINVLAATGYINIGVTNPDGTQSVSIIQGVDPDHLVGVYQMSQLPQTGVYALQFGGVVYSTTQFQLRLSPQQALSVGGAPINQSTQFVREIAYLTFAGIAEQNLTANFTNITESGTNHSNIAINVHKPDGSLWISDNNGGPPSYSEALTNLPDSGTYVIALTPNFFGTMSYSVAITNSP